MTLYVDIIFLENMVMNLIIILATGIIIKQNKKLAAKGENIETEVTVDLEEAFYGSEKKIALRTVSRKNENIYSKNTSRN